MFRPGVNRNMRLLQQDQTGRSGRTKIVKMRVQHGEPSLVHGFCQLSLNKLRIGDFCAAVFQFDGRMRDLNFHGSSPMVSFVGRASRKRCSLASLLSVVE